MNALEQKSPALSTSDDGGWYEPVPLPEETVRPPIVVAEILRRDKVPPPQTLLQSANHTLGTEPIPAARYYSQEFFELERQKLWPKVWQYACWTHDIPDPGDIHVYRILDRSVLIVRQPDGSLKAFINACLHRGRELCERSGQQRELKCPYHYFTWGLDGGLKWVPSKWDFPQLRPEEFRLPEVRVAQWNGFIFINFDPHAPALEAYLGRHFLEQWSNWDYTNRYKALHVRKLIQCNWKTGQDAFIEGFHAFASHSQGAAVVPDDCSQQDIYPDDPHVSRFIIPVGYPSPRLNPPPAPQETFEMLCAGYLPEALGTEEGRIQEGEDSRDAAARIARKSYEKMLGIDASKLSAAEALDAISYFVFPNFMPWPTLAFPLVYRFRPAHSPDWCIWETMFFLPFEGKRPASAPVIELGADDPMENVAALGGLALVLHQDAVQLPAVQRGMKNLASGWLTLTRYQELRIRHYHRTLEQYLGL
jgi:nitrite reductase/ring-hydroxylating ferredoxin subunit